jgi:deoxyribodipyrimidine photo-lyase
MSVTPSLVWFRHDLRLSDQPALQAAIARGGPIIPVFLWAPQEEGEWAPGGASRWWLHHSLKALEASLLTIGSRLILRSGSSLESLRELAKATGAGAIFWNRRYEPAIIERDQKIKETLRADGLEVKSFNAALLHEPWEIQNKSGKPFQVFTPYWKHCVGLQNVAPPLSSPTTLAAPQHWPKSATLESLELLPRILWDGGMQSTWHIGELAAQERLRAFARAQWATYSEERNRPDHAGTSRLSPHLHFGEISPRQVWAGLKAATEQSGILGWQQTQYVAEIGWREFAYHLLYHFPKTPTQPLRAEWQGFPVIQDENALRAWSKGRTGYPIVDAGMRELWTTGWMHNRVRMIVASFLVKDLFLPWQEGAKWFWDTLVDADLAANTLGWQWTAGCGADAAPYFRIFNPTSQGQKFDPNGDYVRRWVPELKSLAAADIHLPGVAAKLGKGYPQPIVDHSHARDRALEAYSQLRKANKGE